MALLRLPLKDIIAAAWHTFLRFPFTLFCAVLGTFVMWQKIDVAYDNPLQPTYLKLAMTSALGLILFFTLELMAERKGNKPVLRYGLAGVGLLLLLGYYLRLPQVLPSEEILRYLLFMLGLHLAASFAAFLNTREENGFWQFNKSLFLRLLTSALYTGVLYLGIALALLAIRELFDVKIDPDVFGKLWVFMTGVFNTWFFLAGVPDPTLLEQETDYPKGLKLFTQYVLLPLVTLYLLILYGYMGKIVFQWDWPRGWVSYLVLGFSTAGIFSLLLIHPIRFSAGNRWIRTYAVWFYRALFPLLVLLLLAIWRRVRDYGITENRYLVLALAFWLLVVAVYFLLSKQKNLKFIPMTLAAAVFLSSFGPWGAFSVSERNQTQRLEELLTAHGLLQNGRIKKAVKEVPARDRKEIGSILDYLGGMHEYASIRPWFGAALDSLFEMHPKYGSGRPSVTQVGNLLGLELDVTETSLDQKYVYLNAEEPEVEVIQGYDFLIDYSVNARVEEQTSQEFTLKDQALQIKMPSQSNQLQFLFPKETLPFSLDTLLVIGKHDSDGRIPAEKATFFLQGTSAEVKLVVRHLEAEREKDTFQIVNVEARVFVKVKD